MDSETQAAIRELADSGDVATKAGLLEALQALGIDCEQQASRVRLLQPLELLDANRIGEALSADTKAKLRRLDIFWSIDSTNTWLLAHAAEADFHGSVCLAEQQIAGKGRRGRRWVSPFGKNIYMSLGWRMSTAAASVAGLSLVVGMQVVAALRGLGMRHIGLKWPNDVLLQRGKLAGILVEMAASPRGEARLVIGIGVNMRLDAEDAGRIDQAFSTVSDQLPASRNALVSRLIDCVVPELVRFERTGFAPYAARWGDFNLYGGLPVSVKMTDGVVHGVDRGVDASGNLQVETAEGIRSFNAGEVSLRPVN